MRNPFVTAVGGVVSADIAVPNHDQEIAFYRAILTTGNEPLWGEDLSNNLGEPIIGLGARTPEYEALPLQWMPHFQVADVAASAVAALELGGSELMHGRDEEGRSLWAGLTDPFGAAFGIIPVVSSEHSSTGSSGQGLPTCGCISWLSLAVPNALSSQEFYRQVIGWEPRVIDCSESKELVAKYEMHIDSENQAAEIMQFETGYAEIPCVWMIHLPVKDLAESLRRVKEAGGLVLSELDDSDSAIIRDPVGVHIALQASNHSK